MHDSPRTHAPAPGAEQLVRREQLPGLEPERRITDWGRSERVEHLIDSTVGHFLYHYWLRVEAEGMENVPRHGGVLLVANRAGQLRLDAAMLAKTLREEHPAPRSLHVAGPPALTDTPGLGMLATKLGVVPEHPANLYRLLHDEGQPVLIFPEARPGRVKPLGSRYRLRRFDRLGFVALAVEAGVPIVPVAILGSEEATPQVSGLGLLGRLTPVRLGIPVPLPARFRLRFLAPVRTDQPEGRPPGRAGTAELAEDIRALIQENLYEMVANRHSVWLG
ncbi:MAG TPA: lysophospholipid acyltransferase family protein [Solirubrobacteraceae bacterium]|nr:lysophospholipid acyltransferase family protein [Solirubrobacteraceae bacterium]